MQDALTTLAFDMGFIKKMSANLYPNPLKFVTRAFFSWEYALKVIKIELELLTDVNMILDFENGIMRAIKATCHYCRSK